MSADAGFPRVSLVHLVGAGLGTVARQEAERQIERDRLRMELAVLVPSDRRETVQAEVDRRLDLFMETWRESPRLGLMPDVAALKSVVDDVVNGRWLL